MDADDMQIFVVFVDFELCLSFPLTYKFQVVIVTGL